VDALQKAKRVDTVATTPETFIDRIRETYPFHPSIRDIIARFSENRGYQKTRALIRLLRLAVRSAFASNANVFLIGLQHLDFNDQATIEEIRKINPAYTNAISRDVADRGNALAERIDAAEGETTASAVAKVLLMSSLSAAETPLRGLTDGELIETLVDPLLEVSEIKAALSGLKGQAWYLFQGVDQRSFLGKPRMLPQRSPRSLRTLPRNKLTRPWAQNYGKSSSHAPTRFIRTRRSFRRSTKSQSTMTALRS
jgi:predicted AAA+ superfamily ATPase